MDVNLSKAEENYIKTIYHLSSNHLSVSTNAIAEHLQTKPASVSDMLKKLAAKEMVHYEKYKGVKLTPNGEKAALWIIRKHRLWEVFLLETLHFNWDEVHEVAEQLEHIKSYTLIERLDKFLDYPQYDPHGDPIPDANGHFKPQISARLSDTCIGMVYKVVAVNDSNSSFLQYLDKVGIGIGQTVEIVDKIDYDGSLEIKVGGHSIPKLVSLIVSENILVTNQK